MPARRRALLAAGAAFAGSLSGCLQSLGTIDEPVEACSDGDLELPSTGEPGPWRQFGRDARNTRYSPEANGPIDGVEVDWRVRHDRELLEPVVDGSIYAVDSTDELPYARSRTLAIDRTDGTVRWDAVELQATRFVPALSEQTIIAATGRDGDELRGVDRSDGARKWRKSVPGGRGTPPTLRDGHVFVGSGLGVIAVDTETGSLAWEYEGDASNEATDSTWSVPAVTGSTVYVIRRGKREDPRSVHAIDRDSSERVWTTEIDLPEKWFVSAAPVVGSDHVFVTTGYSPTTISSETDGDEDEAGRLYALDRSSGDVVWELDFDQRLFSAPALADGTLFVPTNSRGGVGQLHAIDAEDRCFHWSQDLAYETIDTPAVTTETLYYGYGNEVVARNVGDGTIRWRYEIPGVDAFNGPVGTPVLDDRTLYVRTGSANHELTEVVALR